MGPLAVLAHLALRHRNTLTERMNTSRTAAATEIISKSWPLLVLYQGESTVGRNSETLGEMCNTLPPDSFLLVEEKKHWTKVKQLILIL